MVKGFLRLLTLNFYPITATKALLCAVFLTSGIAAQANEKAEIIGSVRTLNQYTKTTGGTIAVGARKVEFIFSSDFAGTITGTSGTIAYAGTADSAKTYVDPFGGLQPKLTYTVSAGTVRIVEYR